MKNLYFHWRTTIFPLLDTIIIASLFYFAFDNIRAGLPLWGYIELALALINLLFNTHLAHLTVYKRQLETSLGINDHHHD